jgi:hypothetical protein
LRQTQVDGLATGYGLRCDRIRGLPRHLLQANRARIDAKTPASDASGGKEIVHEELDLFNGAQTGLNELPGLSFR